MSDLTLLHPPTLDVVPLKLQAILHMCLNMGSELFRPAHCAAAACTAYGPGLCNLQDAKTTAW